MARQSRFLRFPRHLSVISAGFAGGQARPGVKYAPKAILQNDFLAELQDELGYTISYDKPPTDFEKLRPAEDPDHRHMKQPRYVSAATKNICHQVYRSAIQGNLVLTIGGDHSIGIGTTTGIAKASHEQWNRDVGVLWVDAHADINTPETSPSGRIHGMPVAFAAHVATEQSESMFGWITDEHSIKLRKLVYIGIRDLDHCEKICIRENQVKAFTMRDVDQLSIAKVMDEAIAYLGADTPIHLCFDIDAIDPSLAPSTGFPVPGGLTLREGAYIAHVLAESGQLVAIDLVEVNTEIDAAGANKTIDAARTIIKTALGHKLL